MPKFSAQIDHDCKCIECYFCNLFILLTQAEAEDKDAPMIIQKKQ